MSQQLTVYDSRLGHKQVDKSTVEAEAREAAQNGTAMADACRYPFGTQCATHFIAIYLLTAAPAQPTTPDTL